LGRIWQRAADVVIGELVEASVAQTESLEVPVEGSKRNWRGVQVNVQRGGDDVVVIVLDVGESGLAGALWMRGDGVGEGVKETVKFLSPQWWELMRHTVREADRLGLKINLTAGSGWSHSGGPWIKPEHSMQRLELPNG
jgi:hypothetical protein